MAEEECRRRFIRFLGLEWEPRDLAIFIFGIVLFVVGLLLMWLFSSPKFDLSSMLLAILGILVSLGQYATTATKGFINSAVVSRLDEVRDTLADHTEILNRHTEMLNRHVEMLGEHTRLLTEVVNILREVRDALRRTR